MGDLQRIGALAALPALLREMGHNPAVVLGAAGLSPECLEDPDESLSFDAIGLLFQACVDATRCPHFGLLIGQRAGLAGIGIVGDLMRNAPDLRQSVLDLCVNQPRYVRGSVVYLTVVESQAVWGYGICHPAMPAVEHFSEAAIAAGANMLHELTGLRPDDVLLARRAPPDLAPYRRFYGVTPQFDAEQNAIVFAARHLATPVSHADPAVRRALEQAIADYWAIKEPSMTQRVSRTLRARVVLEQPSLADIASEIGLHPRTLKRRLRTEGRDFRSLLNEARFEVARQLLSATGMKVSVIGEALGYADPSGFTRAFERWSGVPPSQWDRGTADE